MQISSLESGDQTKRHKAIHNDEATAKSLSCYRGRDYSKDLPFELIKLVLSCVTYGESARLNRTCKRIRRANINFNPFLHYLSKPVKPAPVKFELPYYISSGRLLAADLKNHRFFVSDGLAAYGFIDKQKFIKNISTVTQIQEGDDQGVKIVNKKFKLKEVVSDNRTSLSLTSKEVYAKFRFTLQGWDINTTEPIEWLNTINIQGIITQANFLHDTVLINGHVLCTKKGLNCSFRKAPDGSNYQTKSYHHDLQRQRAFILSPTDYTVVNSENGDIIHQVTFANENDELRLLNWNMNQSIDKEGWVVLLAKENSANPLLHVRIVELDSGKTILMHKFTRNVVDIMFDNVTKRYFTLNLHDKEKTIDCWQLEISKETGMSLKYLYTKSGNNIYQLHIESRFLITPCEDGSVRFLSIDDNLKEISNLNILTPVRSNARWFYLLDSNGFSIHQKWWFDDNNTTHSIIHLQFKKILSAPKVKVSLEVTE